MNYRKLMLALASCIFVASVTVDLQSPVTFLSICNAKSPLVEVIECEVEQGFAVSIPIGGDSQHGTTNAPGGRGDWDDIW